MLTGLHKANLERAESLAQSAGNSPSVTERHILRTQLLMG